MKSFKTKLKIGFLISAVLVPFAIGFLSDSVRLVTDRVTRLSEYGTPLSNALFTRLHGSVLIQILLLCAMLAIGGIILNMALACRVAFTRPAYTEE